ncbi:toll-like receptor 6 [Megalops cyprinoides]|uniref:toll-like receptor 6 n=1 Tax=Megalops cyprinoides TaxID=118141 RepID=UPI001864F7CC|nr:toll-like receptor 6 [Megalops cyprinoides]
MCMPPTDAQVDLSNHHLTQVPSNLPIGTQYLDLSHNNISELRSGDLASLPDLCVLKATHNGLRFISPLAFTGSSKVQVLNISFNALTTIPDLALPDLRVLDVSENLYRTYRLGKSFENLCALRLLGLGSPQASTVNASDFAPLRTTPLKTLWLGAGVEMEGYEMGSLSQLSMLRELTLKMTFCQNPETFHTILMDLNITKTRSLKLIKFLPDLCNVSSDLSEGLKDMRYLTNLTFQDTWFNSSVLTNVVCNIIQSPIQALAFLNITFAQDTAAGVQINSIPGFSRTASITAITFNTIHHYQYNFPLISINTTFFSHVTYLKFSGTGMSIVPCDIISVPPSLQILDLSDNLLRDLGLWWPACSFTHKFPGLQHLYLRNNKFEDLYFIANHTHQMKTLSMLDLSANAIVLKGQSSWPSHLTSLSLSENSLGDTVFDHLSPHFRSLNLSQTGITALTQRALSRLTGLRRLFLSSNGIKRIPPNLFMPRLEELHVDGNSINTLDPRSFKGLLGLRKLKAGNNPFACNCDLYWFVTSFDKTLLPDWPSDYTCFSPPELAGTPLEKYRPGRVQCSPGIQAAISSMILLTVAGVLGFTFYACDGAWYLQMLWVWLRVKRRGHQGAERLGHASFKYHAFISYSQRDCHWVEAQLVPQLEGANFSLCIHERDFVPGDWIIDNIINCVEGSYKTLFVLSQNFVQSEWCNYELFFAQHRALSVRQDSLVFVLLEPIPADSLPRKFLKLRTLLRQQTYLQWPKEERKKQVFWASLKAMLQTADESVVLRRVALDVADLCPLISDTDQ